MRTPAACLSITRRDLLRALCAALAIRPRPLVACFTAITDDLVWLMRWCCFGPGLRLTCTA